MRHVIAGAVVALILSGCSSSGGGSNDDALVERTCEIFRDISADAADGVDSTAETRDRLRDLLNGYGEAAPNDIARPLRRLVGDMTSGDFDAAAGEIRALAEACSSRVS